MKGKGLEKVNRILIGGRVVSSNGSVFVWMFFIFSEIAVLCTTGRQLGEIQSWFLDS